MSDRGQIDGGADPREREVNFLLLIKGDERYAFLYEEPRASELMAIMGVFASRPDLSFTWYDHAVLCQRIRRLSAGEAAA